MLAIKTVYKGAFLWALFVTLICSVLQIMSLTNASFMGVHSSAFASEVLKYYPYAAAGELLKVLAVAYVPIFLVSLAVHFSQGKFLRLAVVVLFSLSYFFFFSASILNYPALYQDFLSPSLQKAIFNLSFLLSPLILKVCGVVFLLVSVGLVKGYFRQFLFLICLFAFGANTIRLPVRESSEGKISKPHIFLIGIDSFRSDYLRPEIVGNLAELKNGASAISFNDHIIGIPRTFPSWMEILHGKYSAKTGIRHMFPGLLQQRKESGSLVSKLKESGYSAYVVSDFAGDIFPRFNAGYEKILTPNFNLPALTRMSIAQSFPLFLPMITSSFLNSLFPDLLENPCFSDPETLITKSIEAVDSARGPLFLSVFFSNAHFPYAAPWPWYSKYSEPSYSGPYFFKKDPDLSQSGNVKMEDIAQVRSLYSGSLSAIDTSLGRFFSYLKEKNLWDNSIIIVTADHGEDLFEIDMVQGHGEHLRGENVLKVPFLIKGTKGYVQGPKNIDFTSRMIDLAPTVLGLLGMKMESIDGLDLSPWIKESEIGSERKVPQLHAYSETEIWFSRNGNAFFQKERLDYPGIASLLNLDPGGTGAIVLDPNYEKIIVGAKHRSLVSGRYKLIYTPTPQGAYFKLFERVEDPQNRIDIAQKQPEIFRTMKAELMEQILSLESNSKFIENYVVPF